MKGGPSPGRTHQTVKRDMRAASLNHEVIHGIKGPSPVLRLTGLDLVWGFPPDYMHCVLEGVTKQLTELWLTFTGTPFYVGRLLGEIDNRLSAIRPPISFSRSVRSLRERAFWKATEWRYWLLFYSLPSLHGFLPRIYLHHLSHLSVSVFLLLKEVVTEQDIYEAEKRLEIFVVQMGNLYGDVSATFNVHQLLHLGKSVRMFGPLWATSTFPFENGNGHVLRLVSAAKGVPMQIAERCIMRETVEAARCTVPLVSFSDHTISLLEPRRNSLFQNSVLGIPQPQGELLVDFQTVWKNKLGFIPDMQRYLRAQVGQIIIHSVKYTCAKKTCSSYVKMLDGKYCKVLDIFSFTDRTKKIALFTQVLISSTQQLVPNAHIVQCVTPPPTQNLCLYLGDDVCSQCVFIKVGNDSYICEVPNKHERD